MSLAWAMGIRTARPGEGLGDIQQAWQVHTEPRFLIQSPGRVSWRWEMGACLRPLLPSLSMGGLSLLAEHLLLPHRVL